MMRRATLVMLLLWLVWPVAGQAQLRVAATTIKGPAATLDNVQVTLADAVESGGLQIEADIGTLSVPMLGWRKVNARFDGRLSRPTSRHWHLEGQLALQGAVGRALRKARLTLDLDAEGDTLEARLDGDGARLALAMPLDGPLHLQLNMSRLPLDWLQGVLVQAWPDGRLGGGRVDAAVAVDVLADEWRSNGHFRLDGGAFDSRDGMIAGQTLAGSGNWSLRVGEQTSRMDLDASLVGGDYLLGPIYASLPPRPTRLRLRADMAKSGIRLSNVHFDDGGSLRFDGGIHFDPHGAIASLQLDGIRARLPEAYDRYGKSWLATLGYDQLDSAGMFTGSLAVQGGALQRFSFDADGVTLRDPGQRLGVEGLRGRLDWSRDASREPTVLAWDGLTLEHLPLGAARTQWRSADGTLSLLDAASMALLGGRVRLQRLDWSPDRSRTGTQLDMGLVATGIDLESLCKLLGWPPFQGTLGGAIPGLSFADNRLLFEGGLSMNVFDGFVDVTQLSLAHPFGAAPELRANIAMRQLDLEPLTHVFDFGSISGRLDGDIDALRMIAWKPVAFDASLRADSGGRISQRAINSLSHLGGGIGAGLQSTVLKVFKSFGYDRIGLGCQLRDDVCRMHGVGKAAGDGYVIVDGRGLPHIEVVGHQHEVDWPTLVARLIAATEGGGVRVE